MDPIAEDEEYSGHDEESSVEMRLSLLLLEKENATLKEEIKSLKTTIQTLCMNECVSKKKKVTSEVTVKKWQYYHEHKETVRRELKEDATWRDVKRATDARFLAGTEAQRP